MRQASWLVYGFLLTLIVPVAPAMGQPAPEEAENGPEVPERRAPTLDEQAKTVPYVEGAIVQVAISPDGKRVAFWLVKDEQRSALGLYDLEAKKLLAEVPLHGASREPMVWSTDSQFVTMASLDEQDHFLLERNGAKRDLSLPFRTASEIVWRTERPAAFVYSVRIDEVDQYREHNVATAEDRLIRRVGRRSEGLHLVREKPCYVTRDEERKRAGGRWVRVRRVDDNHEIFRVWLPRGNAPIPGTADSDGPSILLSPNGRFVHMGFQGSATTYEVLAWAKDASAVIWKPRLATRYTWGMFDWQSVRWRLVDDGWMALVDDQNGKLVSVLNAADGTDYSSGFRDVKVMDYGPNGDRVGVAPQGLALSDLPGSPSWGPRLLLLGVRGFATAHAIKPGD